MVPELTLEAIYFGVPTDFKMEFDLCGCCSVRFLSAAVNDVHSFLLILKKSVARSRVIVTVGGFTSDVFLPSDLGAAIGLSNEKVDKTLYGINERGDIILPKGAIPLVTVKGLLGGLVLESKDQAIIMLSENSDRRSEVLKTLVCPYITLLSKQKVNGTGLAPIVENTAPPQEHEVEPTTSESVSITELETNEVVDVAVNTAAVADESADNTMIDVEKDVKQKPLLVVEELTSHEQKSDQALLQKAVEPEVKPVFNSLLSAETPSQTPSIIPPVTDDGKQTPVTYSILESSADKQSGELFLPVLGDFISDDWNPEFNEKKSKQKILRAVIAVILVVAVLLGAYFGYQDLYRPMQCDAVYQNVLSLYGQKTDKELPSGVLSKFGRLYLMNNDMIGWLNLPGTTINYPVVSTKKSSPTYYNSHLFDGSLNDYGTIYTPMEVTKESFARNMLVYGKDLSNGKMMSELVKYKDLGFYRSAPVITFDTIYSENNWKIFSVFSVGETSQISYNRVNFFDDSDFEGYMAALRSASLIQTPVDVKGTDEILTLVSKGAKSTTVVVARKVRSGESSLVDVTGSTVKEDNSSSAETSTDSNSSYHVSGLIDLGEITNTDNGSRYEQTDPALSEDEIASNIAGIKPKPIVSSKPSSSSSGKVATSSISTSHISSQSSSMPISSSASHQSSKPTSSTVTSSAPPVDLSKLPILTVTNASVNPKVKVSGSAVDIIANVLEAEMGSGFHIEALKAQAVAAYSWMLCNGAATGSAPEVPMKTAGNRAKEAAKSVAGICAVYNGTIAQTYYYAISAGRSANCEDIWSASLPYLKSVDSSVDKNISGYQTIRTYSASDVKRWVFDQTGIDLGSVTDKTKWFAPKYDSNGLYVKTISIGSTSFKGTYLRDKLFTSARVGTSNVLRSSAYTIAYNKADDKFTFTVKGYGHGVGMSQVGANAYANSGWTYEQILKHYYTGISLGTYLKD